MTGTLTRAERGCLSLTRLTRRPKRINSRTERPCAAACSLSLRYKKPGYQPLSERLALSSLALSDRCHKYGTIDGRVPGTRVLVVTTSTVFLFRQADSRRPFRLSSRKRRGARR